jgi:hypothetical protein
MLTRSMYLNEECTHSDYYGQFVDESITRIVKSTFHFTFLDNAFKADAHFNTIALVTWDSLAKSLAQIPGLGKQMRDCGDFPTLAGYVCILKEAARIVLITPSLKK